MIATGLLSQFLGNVVTLASYDDAWIFNGLTKFLQYFIATTTNSMETQIFTTEVLHPTLYHQRLRHGAGEKEDERGKNVYISLCREKTFSMPPSEIKIYYFLSFSQLLAFFT